MTRVNPNLVFFSDPAGVAGDGSPSGGPDPASGIVEVGNQGALIRATCTLPKAQHTVCTTVLNDVIKRYAKHTVTGARACPDSRYGYTHIKITNGSCTTALRVVSMRTKVIPGTNNMGFTLGPFKCRVTQNGSENTPKPAKYRCELGRVVLTYAYHP